MTMIDVDTSPLQAAREWRGIGLVAAAMNCGLPVAQAEALECGDPAAFTTIDEMIAAAVVYGSSIGIGRDEAMALLDRTVCRTGAQVSLPDADPIVARPLERFSETVHERSARIADRHDVVSSDVVAMPLLSTALTGQEMVAHPVLDPIIDEPSVPSIELPAIPEGPTPEQAVAASGELHLDGAFGPDAPWERDRGSDEIVGELDAWVDDADGYVWPDVSRERDGETMGARLGAMSFAALERIVGTDRADAVADRTREMTSRVSDVARTGRERLRRSEHATLFVAIGAGAILIAIVVALGGALGSNSDPAGPGPANRTAAKGVVVTEIATEVAPKAAAPGAAAAVKPIIPPARLTLDIFNAGSKKGYAKEVAAKLDAAGYKIGEVTNSKSTYSGATIIHPADMAREAKLLARQTGISTMQVAPGSTRKITIVVT